MTLDSVVDILRKRLGLDPESLGPTVVPSAIATRQRALGLTNPAAYASRLKNSPQELEALIEDLVVSETWFFRGGDLFPFLVEHIRTVAAARTAAQPFRVLSVPCSTGEEPYSLAMALTDEGVPCTAWRIDAFDISQRHLDRALRGRYSDFSFRQTADNVRDRYFTPLDNGWQLSEKIRAMVDFRRGNLADPEFLADAAPYDLIFCRNVLIYLHDEARQQAIAALARLLAPEGLICMGHAEPLSTFDRRFGRVGADGLFLFSRVAPTVSVTPTEAKKTKAAAARPTTASPVRPSRAVPASASPTKTAATAPRPATAPATNVTTSNTAAVDLLARARRQADAGQLDEAWDACQALLVSGPTADAYALLGVIQQARRDEAESKRCFEKALYLDPQHGEALLHLMLLCEQQGAHAQAAVLRRRWERAGQRGDA